MSLQFSDYTGQFFWDFKRMDNVNYNFEIIELLYQTKKQNGNNTKFNKPLIILIMAIIECMLYDLIIRIHSYRSDPFPNISQGIVSYFRNFRETDELRVLIPRIISQNLLRAGVGDSIYDDLDELRKIRNRVHIQNKYFQPPADEYNTFTDRDLQKAEKTLERVCEVLCNVYPRWNKQPLSMSDFPRPWV